MASENDQSNGITLERLTQSDRLRIKASIYEQFTRKPKPTEDHLGHGRAWYDWLDQYGRIIDVAIDEVEEALVSR